MNMKQNKPAFSGPLVRRTALAMAIAAGFGLSGQVLAQATSGSIIGTAPVAAGETVKMVNVGTGLTREVQVDASGRFSANSMPTGTYTVSLISNGQVVASQDHVQVSVGGAASVPFAAKETKNLATVTVTANALPPIDVASTRQSAVITAQQLKDLPIAHNAESIAILAPGVTFGGNSLGTGPNGAPLVSMGGSSVVENAYYLNGFNTTDPIGGAGGITLPYWAIAEQQTITSGYGPEYGRSTGGVISQLGARGSNQWHAGVYVDYRPSFAESSYDNITYSNPLTPVGIVTPTISAPPGVQGIAGGPYLANQGSTGYPAGYGQIENGQRQNSDWETVYDAYISGPLIKDKLFFFLTAEWQHDSNQAGVAQNGINTPAGWQSTSTNSPKIYGKLDWNINDSNILELTGVKSDSNVTGNNYYNYNYSNQSVASYYGPGLLTKNDFNVGILKYTSYITDDLTLEVLYGQMNGTYYQQLPGGNQPQVLATGVPTSTPGYANLATAPNLFQSQMGNPDHTSKVQNLRVDLDWKITEAHDLKFGIDNMQTRDDSDGFNSVGGSSYQYFTGLPIYASTAPYVNTPVVGNYVQQNLVSSDINLGVRQKAQYVEDRWQVMPNLLLDLGLRNDQFTNIAPGGVQYVRETSPQWAPRLGFSWDVFGDSTTKLFGNAGRYYLALPTGLAARNTAYGTYNGEITYTYTSIGPGGIPQGLTPVLVVPAVGVTTPGYYSPDGENGLRGNGKDYASTNLKPEYQDQYVLGFQKMLGDTGLVFGTTATYQKTGNFIDDSNLTDPYGCPSGLVNPGKTNYIPCTAAPGGEVTWNPNTGEGVQANYLSTFPTPSRKYYGLETYLEHSWDGKWYAKIDYLFSKSYGSTEGPTDTAIGQISNQTQIAKQKGGLSGSTTAQWDFPDLMQYANGELPNSRRHTLKAFGAYAISPEWTVSGTYIIQSGAPNVCLSGFGSIVDPDLYGGPYQHYCGGTAGGNSTQTITVQTPSGPVLQQVGFGGLPSPPGDSGHSPWTHQLNLALTYVPTWGNKHLTFQAQVHNVFNEQNATQLVSYYMITTVNGAGVWNPAYKTPLVLEQPRYMDFSVKFDW
ncbi:MAG: TonB-dependent receptor [Rhodanobacter sp.]